ncbi:C69 family dipeptidase [uncultured Porphyromonas sp.]|uniref:dipeptidase n=1 Tax=uncultured Porphyromonas sp. TaxID=159274 RepID=UPI002615479D|nr:C69 family dipeptidase [uncultured Porphyromonas sp.]
MKQFALLGACALATALLLPQPSSACSDLIVGKKASADGSVMVSYSADSHTLYGDLVHYPSKAWGKGLMLEVHEWDTGKPLGFIPQAAVTYNVIGNMNEHQVAITESTWGGRKELSDPKGIMDYGSLIYIALQRSQSAREAIRVMTDLVRDYGYYSSGESFTVADKNEVWILEMIGKGPNKKGAVWVAIRIPDNAISAHANQARIHKIPFGDKENCMYEKDVVKLARENGWYTGKSDKDFDFQKAYNPYDFSGLRACEARVWSFFRSFDKGMDKYTKLVQGDVNEEPMPLYIVPDRKVTLDDVRRGMRNHYEDTPLSMTNDPGAGAYKVPYRWRPMTFKVDGKEYVNERAIATQQTGFVLIAQLRSWLPDVIGGILWFGVDDANTAVLTPMYASITSVPECYRRGNGSMTQMSWTSAFWIHNWVANMAYHRYEPMIQDIRPVQTALESSFNDLVKTTDEYALALMKTEPSRVSDYLTRVCDKVANETTARWKQLGEYLLVKYMDGNVKKEKDGKFEENGYGQIVMPNFPGYSKEYYESIARSGEAEHLVVPKKNAE